MFYLDHTQRKVFTAVCGSKRNILCCCLLHLNRACPLQVNTEPAKSKNFSLVVNLPASDGQEGGGRGSEHAVARSSEVSRDVVEGFGGGEVLLKGGGEASVLSESSEESLGRQGEAELGEVEVEVDEVVDEVKENENGEKQSRSIVSVRLGEEGSRFSFAKVGLYKLSFY